MISVTVVGNLGSDAETKKVGDGTVTKFRVASSVGKKGDEKTTWVGCDYWGKAGEAVSQYLKKGQTVAVAGSLSTREHDGKTYVELRVNELKLIGSKPGGQNSGGGGSSRSTSSRQQSSFDGPDGGYDGDSIPF